MFVVDGVDKDSAYIDAYGFLRCKAVISRIGVQEYPQADGSVRLDLRLPEEVERSTKEFNLIPVVLFHPDDGIVTADSAKSIVGFVGDLSYQDGFVSGNATITHKEAITAIMHGVSQLSCGYTCELEESSGAWIDTDGLLGEVSRAYEYTALQKNIKINHVALVPTGRAGDKVALKLDAADEIELESVELQVIDMEEALTAIANLTAMVQALQETVKAPEPVASIADTDVSEEVNKQVEARLDSWSKVKVLLPEIVIDSALSPKQIKQNAIAQLNPELAKNLDEADESYINGLFAALSATKKETPATAPKTEIAVDSAASFQNMQQMLNESRPQTSANDSQTITNRRKSKSL